MGRKLTEKPGCLEGTCLVAGLQKLTGISRLPAQVQMPPPSGKVNFHTGINSKYWDEVTPDCRRRWKVYGAPNCPLPCQGELDRLMARLTRCPKTAKLWLMRYNLPDEKVKLDRSMQAAKEMEGIKAHLMGRNIRLPLMWASHTEIKTRLKAAQEGDEQKVIQALSQQTEPVSTSAKMLAEWGLDRDRVKRILQFLETDRSLQTTFTNLIGATRFKALKEGELRRTKCPKCGGIDSWSRCVECYELQPKPMQEAKQWLGKIKRLLITIKTESPAMYQASDLRIGEQQEG